MSGNKTIPPNKENASERTRVVLFRMFLIICSPERYAQHAPIGLKPRNGARGMTKECSGFDSRHAHY